MAKVYFVREEISIEIPVGTSVLEAEIQAGLAPDVPCGGQGTCGKCLVKVDGKPVLACQTKVEKDCQVEIPGKKNRGKILSEGLNRSPSSRQLKKYKFFLPAEIYLLAVFMRLASKFRVFPLVLKFRDSFVSVYCYSNLYNLRSFLREYLYQ